MRPPEVLVVFDEKQVYEDWMGGNLNDALLFHGMRLHFNECNGVAPLPYSMLEWVVVYQREDAYLFGRLVSTWTKASIVQELLSRGYAVQTPANGDVDVPGQLGLSFTEDGQLHWVELYAPDRWSLAAAAVWRFVVSWLTGGFGR